MNAICVGLLALTPAIAPSQDSASQDAPEWQPPSAADLPAGMTLEEARELHDSLLTLDTHKDISDRLADPKLKKLAESGDPEGVRLYRRNDPTVDGSSQVDFPKMRQGGLDSAFYIVYVGQGDLDAAGYALAAKQATAKFDAIHRMARRYPDHIQLATTPDDVERAHDAGKLVACIGIENGYPMGEDLSAIQRFHRRGARYMGLVHNRHSQLGDSHTPADEKLHGGLSELGRKAIHEMNRVGIMVDISHASAETTLQALAASKAPVIASHSGADGVYEHGRNLSDPELLALKKNGGVLQCVAFKSYVKGDGGRRAFIDKTREELGLPTQRGIRPAAETPEERAKMRRLRELVKAFDATVEASNVDHFVDHIDYAVRLIGIDHVGISSDFDGGGGVEGWNSAAETFNVTLELLSRGYSRENIQKLWGGNLLRVWREVEAVAAGLQR
ncbi:MAG: dipeptidase [Planctomycetota bacterium]